MMHCAVILLNRLYYTVAVLAYRKGPASSGENLLNNGAITRGYTCGDAHHARAQNCRCKQHQVLGATGARNPTVKKKICSTKKKAHRYSGTYGPVCCRMYVKPPITGGPISSPRALCTQHQASSLPIRPDMSSVNFARAPLHHSAAATRCMHCRLLVATCYHLKGDACCTNCLSNAHISLHALRVAAAHRLEDVHEE